MWCDGFIETSERPFGCHRISPRESLVLFRSGLDNVESVDSKSAKTLIAKPALYKMIDDSIQPGDTWMRRIVSGMKMFVCFVIIALFVVCAMLASSTWSFRQRAQDAESVLSETDPGIVIVFMHLTNEASWGILALLATSVATMTIASWQCHGVVVKILGFLPICYVVGAWLLISV